MTTLSDPEAGRIRAAAPAGARPTAASATAGCLPLGRESPCQLGSLFAEDLSNLKMRVCVPASISTFSVLSSSHVMCTRPGTRMIAAAP